VIAAETDEEAEMLSTSSSLFYLNVVRGTKNLLQPPVDSMDGRWNFYEESMAHGMSKYTFKGDRNTISEQISRFCGEIEIDELMAVSYIYDQEKRKRSYEILKDAVNQ
jgi:alkanesulfonate monooxygenase SsuD/methylene tetrahydromethanopterin reductase-like flavin-dependent oxidoreductase (luciferase family)